MRSGRASADADLGARLKDESAGVRPGLRPPQARSTVHIVHTQLCVEGLWWELLAKPPSVGSLSHSRPCKVDRVCLWMNEGRHEGMHGNEVSSEETTQIASFDQ